MKNIISIVLLASAAVIFIAVGIDILRDYIPVYKAYLKRKKSRKQKWARKPLKRQKKQVHDAYEMIARGVSKYRTARALEIGVIIRPHIPRRHGSHRRVTV